MGSSRREISALVESGCLFLPAGPAFLWLWPWAEAAGLTEAVQALVYVYFLAGALWIGRRRWSWDELGVNRRGLGLGLACGGVFLAERVLAYLALRQPLSLRPFDAGRLAWEIFYYFALVGLVEELFFRGLLFRLLESWRGAGLAVFGSAALFALWHIGWAGPWIAAHFLIGLVWGLIRWRAGGIAGLVLVHGLNDLLGVEAQAQVTFENIPQLIQHANGWAILAGDVLLVGLVVYLWKLHPRLARKGQAA